MKKCTNPNCLQISNNDNDMYCGVCGSALQPVQESVLPIQDKSVDILIDRPAPEQQPVYQEQQPVYQEQQPYYPEQQPPVYQEQQPVYQEQQPYYQEQQPIYDNSFNQYAYQPATAPLKPKSKAKWFKPLLVFMLAVVFILGAAIVFVMLDPFGEKETALTVDEMIEFGEKYLLDLDYEPALVEFLRVIEVELMNPRGYTGAAEAYIGLEKYTDAKQVLQQGLEVLPGNREITDMLSIAEGLLIEYIPGENINIDIVQIDSSDFPVIRFYVNVTNDEGDVVEGLSLDIFDVLELDAAGNWTQAQIEELRQLLAGDTVNVGLVIDKSGSMSDYNRMEQARNAASYFLTYLESESNNFVEVTYFDSSVIVPHTFTEDFETLREHLYYYPADGGTALYDALYSALLRTDAQSGAKCIIAFTDGDENSSRATLNDVTALAQATGIPIYMIGVGRDVNEGILMHIADITGGAYFSSENTDLEDTLQSIYLDVFRTYRNQYIVRYISSIDNNLEDLHKMRIRTRDDSGYEGEAGREFIPVPPPPPLELSPPPQTLWDAIHNMDYWVRIIIERPDTGRGTTIFERDINSNVWAMSSLYGSFRIVNPDFRQSGTSVHIGFPTTNSRYDLNRGVEAASGDGTGVSNNDPLIWRIETGNDFTLGTAQDENRTDNLKDALEHYYVIAIYMYFNNGDYTILYRDHENDWRIKPRSVGLLNFSPSIIFEGDATIFTFRAGSKDYRYVFYDGGQSEGDGENTTWSYSYYLR